jgi:hypothetical protein
MVRFALAIVVGLVQYRAALAASYTDAAAFSRAAAAFIVALALVALVAFLAGAIRRRRRRTVPPSLAAARPTRVAGFAFRERSGVERVGTLAKRYADEDDDRAA